MIQEEKIKTYEEIVQLIKHEKEAGKRVGLVTGCFDIVHAGHVDFLRFAKSHCDVLVVGLDKDESIRLTKGNWRPIHTIKLRTMVLSEFSCIDYIFEFPKVYALFAENSSDYAKMISELTPTYLITNCKADRLCKHKANICEHIHVVFLQQQRIRYSTATSEIVLKARKVNTTPL